jgi:hypothetical protein
MGDFLSSKKNTTNNVTENRQVALQGRGQIGLSSSQVQGDINVTSSDPEVVLAAIEQAGRSTNAAALVSAAAIDANKQSTSRAFDTADTAILSTNVQLGKTLDFLSESQRRNLNTVDAAVDAAQQTALLATPQSSAAYGEITGSQNNKTMLAAGAILVALYLLTRNKSA